MFVSPSHAINSYQRIGVESGVFSADPHKLILMLFEGAQQALDRSRLYIRQNKIAAKREMISKAITIIDHGLKVSRLLAELHDAWAAIEKTTAHGAA